MPAPPGVGSRFWVGAVLVASAWLAGARPPDAPCATSSRPRDRRARSGSRTGSPSSGIGFVLDNATTPEKPVIDAVLGGLALLDFDGDGRLDVFFTNGARIPGLVKDDPRFWNRLYRSQGDGTFRDVTEGAGVRGEGYSMGVAAADFDNDGWTDLYVTGVNRNILYRNRGDGTFADVTEQAGVAGLGADGRKLWSVGAAWLDYDNDGDLDLFVTNYLDWTPENNRVCGAEGRRLSCSPTFYAGLPNLLYRNEGGGRFRDVSDSMRISEHVGRGMSVAVADADGDGFTDVFVANDQGRNFLFRNQGGRAFVEHGVESGVAYTEDGVPVSGMGADFRDLDEDGRPDIFLTALSGEAFPLYLNTAEGFFVPSTHAAGLGFATVTMSGWGTGAYDFDNDGQQGAVHRQRARQREHRLVRIASLPAAERALPGPGRRPLPRRDTGDRRGHAAPRGPPWVRLRRPGRRRARRRGGLGDRRAGRRSSTTSRAARGDGSAWSSRARRATATASAPASSSRASPAASSTTT